MRVMAPARFYPVHIHMSCSLHAYFFLPRDCMFPLASYALALFRGFADFR